MSKRTSIEEVKNEFVKKNYIPLFEDNDYKNNKSKLKFKCTIHPDKENSICLSNLKNDQGCVYCGREKSRQSLKLSYDYVSNYFQSKGYLLLEDEYDNAHQVLKFRCSKHPYEETKISYHSLQQGSGCYYCGLESKSQTFKKDYEDVKSAFESVGLVLLECEYMKNDVLMKCKCHSHPDIEMYKTYGAVQQGKGCKYCYFEKITGSGSYRWSGGTSKFNDYLRDRIEDWRKESLEKYNFTCQVTGERGVYLQVHHITPFNELRDETLKELNLDKRPTAGDYSEEELIDVVTLFKEKHNNTGIPIKKEIHDIFHKIYGHNVNLIQFEEFKRRYLSGEFSNLISA